jgi:hypothetical protein
MSAYFYLITDATEYELPVATCENQQEVAKFLGVTPSAVSLAIKSQSIINQLFKVFIIYEEEGIYE